MSVQPQFWGWSTSPLTIPFWGWEESTTAPNVISGIPHIVLPAGRWIVINFVPSYKAVKDSFTPQVVIGSTFSKVSCDSLACKIINGTVGFKTVQAAFIPRVQTSDAVSKAMQEERVSKASIERVTPKICVPNGAAKIGR